jgi:hypothetical protein
MLSLSSSSSDVKDDSKSCRVREDGGEDSEDVGKESDRSRKGSNLCDG